MTRKIAALALAALPALAAARDLGPGTFEVGAGSNLSFGKLTSELNDSKLFDVTTTTLSGDALYYPLANVGFGLGLSYDKTKTEYAAAFGGASSDSTTWTFGPEVKVNVPVSPAASLVAL